MFALFSKVMHPSLRNERRFSRKNYTEFYCCCSSVDSIPLFVIYFDLNFITNDIFIQITNFNVRIIETFCYSINAIIQLRPKQTSCKHYEYVAVYKCLLTVATMLEDRLLHIQILTTSVK